MAILTTAHIARSTTASSPLTGFTTVGAELLVEEDPQLHGALCAEHSQQESALSLLPGTSAVDPSVLSCMAAVTRSAGELAGMTAAVHSLAVQRAKTTFGARYANVLPNSLAAAGHGVLSALAGPSDRVLDLRGTPAAVRHPPFETVAHSLAGLGQTRCHDILELAERSRPRVIVCGGHDCPRAIDFGQLRAIADAVGALLVADVSQVAGQILVGLWPSPIDKAHVTITCTHTQLAGPQGGIVLCGHDADLPVSGGTPLAGLLEETLTWSWSGASSLAAIAGKARALQLVQSDSYRETVQRAIANASQLSDEMHILGYPVVPAEYGNQIVVVDLSTRSACVAFAVRALKEVNIMVEATRIPAEDDGSVDRPGLRLGTSSVAQRQFGFSEMRQAAELVDTVLGAVRPNDDAYQIEEFSRLSVHDAVRRLMSQFPLPRYVPVSRWGGVA